MTKIPTTLPEWEECHYNIKDVMMDITSDEENAENNITLTLNKNGEMAIRMFDTLAIYVYAGKKMTRFSIKQEYYQNIDELIDTKPEKLRAGWSIMPLDSIQSLHFYSGLIHAIYGYEKMRSRSDLFSCCSRYEACSDAMQCVLPYPELKSACSYRIKLLKGIVYYGKNKNI